MHVNPINQNILKIEKNYTFIHHETVCQDESVVFFYFQYVSHSTLVYRALYYGKIETLTSQLTKTCIVNKNQMRRWFLSKVNGHDNLEIKAF